MSTAAHCRLSLLELPGRLEAELAIKAASENGQRTFATLLVADGILALSEQFAMKQAIKCCSISACIG